MKTQPPDGRDAEIGRLKAKVRDLTMPNELLTTKIEHLEAERPLARPEVETMSRRAPRPPPAERKASCGWPGSGA